MKLALASLVFGSVAAFTPSSTPRVSSNLNMVNKLELGVTEPLRVFDPLG